MRQLGDELSRALEQLASRDLEVRVKAVENLAQIANGTIDNVVEEFAQPGDARYLIFERLGRFGSSAIRPLEQLLNRSEDAELRILASAALLQLGSTVGVEILLQSIRAEEPLVCLAVRVLSDANISEARPLIESLIEVLDLGQTDTLECLVTGLRHFVDPLPEQIRTRLQDVKPAWRRDSFL